MREALCTNPTAERLVLALIVQDPLRFWDVASRLGPEDFGNHGNRLIFQAMAALSERHDQWTPTTLAAWMDGQGTLDPAGGQGYLEALAHVQVAAEDLDWYVQQVQTMAVRRRLIRTAEAIITDLEDGVGAETEPLALVTAAVQRLEGVAQGTTFHDGVQALHEAVEASLPTAERPTTLLGVPSPFPLLDEQTLGWEPGKLYVLGAPAKTGKSTWLLNCAVEAARQGVPILYLDTEMSADEQRSRALALLAGVPERHLPTGLFYRDPRAVERVRTAIQTLRGLRIFHRALPLFDLPTLGALIRKYRQREGIGLVIFDYIKIPANDTGRREEWQQLGILTTFLKDVATQVQVPILTAAQLRRGAKDVAQLDGEVIQGSYRIIQYANMMLYLRPKTDEEMREHGPGRGNMILTIGESRQGGNYTGYLQFYRAILRMEELENVAEQDVAAG